MNKRLINIYMITLTALFVCLVGPTIFGDYFNALAQTDRHEVRSGNRKFAKKKYAEADIDFRKALVKDSLSVAANYNLANNLYRQKNFTEAEKYYSKTGDLLDAGFTSPSRNVNQNSDYLYNRGLNSLSSKDYSAAVEHYKKALLANPADLDAKENYIYAKKLLEEQQKQQQNQDKNNQEQNKDNKDQNKNNQDQNNQEQNKDKQNQNKDNKDDKKDQNKDNQDKNKDQNKDQNAQNPKISPRQASQMLNAMKAKEKETKDKVDAKKAQALKSKQKDKNW